MLFGNSASCTQGLNIDNGIYGLLGNQSRLFSPSRRFSRIVRNHPSPVAHHQRHNGYNSCKEYSGEAGIEYETYNKSGDKIADGLNEKSNLFRSPYLNRLSVCGQLTCYLRNVREKIGKSSGLQPTSACSTSKNAISIPSTRSTVFSRSLRDTFSPTKLQQIAHAHVIAK